MQALFRATVLHVNVRDYTQDEVADWASCGDNAEHWQSLLDRHRFIATLDRQGGITGFTSMNAGGHLHSPVRPRGLAGQGHRHQAAARGGTDGTRIRRKPHLPGSKHHRATFLRKAGLPGGAKTASEGQPALLDELRHGEKYMNLLKSFPRLAVLHPRGHPQRGIAGAHPAAHARRKMGSARKRHHPKCLHLFDNVVASAPGGAEQHLAGRLADGHGLGIGHHRFRAGWRVGWRKHPGRTPRRLQPAHGQPMAAGRGHHPAVARHRHKKPSSKTTE